MNNEELAYAMIGIGIGFILMLITIAAVGRQIQRDLETGTLEVLEDGSVIDRSNRICPASLAIMLRVSMVLDLVVLVGIVAVKYFGS